MKTRDELEEMIKPDLVEYGKTLTPPVLLDMAQKKGDMVMSIMRATGVPAETAKDAPALERNAKDLPPVNRLSSLDGKPVKARMWDLMIHATESDRGDVSVSVNGYLYKIKRGVTVRVPEPVVEVLKNSLVHTVRYNPESRRNEPATILTYPFNATPVEDKAA